MMIRSYVLEDIEGFGEDSALVEQLNLEQEAKSTGDYDKLKEKTAELEEDVKNGTEAPVSDTSPPDSSEEDDATPPDDGTGGDNEGDAADDSLESDDADPTGSEEEGKDKADDEPKKDDSEEAKGDSKDKESVEKEDKPEEDEPLKDKDGKKQSVVTESLRDEYYDRIILESIGDSLASGAMAVKTGAMAAGAAVIAGSVAGAVYAAGFLRDAVKVLFELGIKYTPTAFAYAKKATIYLFFKSAKLTLKLMRGVSDFMKRYKRSVNRKEKDIANLLEKLNKLEFEGEKGDKFTPTKHNTVDEKYISWFTVNQKTNPIYSAETLLSFMNTVVSELDKRTTFDINAVSKLIELSSSNSNLDPTMVLGVAPFQAGFLRKRVEGHLKDPDLIDPYVYGTILPDNTVLAANIPRKDLRDIDTIARAYGESSMFLTSDNRHPPTADKVDYMDSKEIRRLLDILNKICELSNSHLAFYSRIEKNANKLKLGYKHYYLKLTSEKGEAYYEKLSEYIYLKQSFVNKVYLPAAMDIHDYAMSYLLVALKYVRENIKLLEAESTV